MTLKYRTYAEAWAVNERVTADCIRNNQWPDGITTNYCQPKQDEHGQWEVPILPLYEQYFTLAEISRAQTNKPEWHTVPTWRLRAVLSLMGKEQMVTDAIEQLPEPQRTFARFNWNGGGNSEYDSPAVAFIVQVLQLSPEEKIEIFQTAYNAEI